MFIRGACTDSMIKPDVPLQGLQPPSSSSHVHIRYKLPVALGPPSLARVMGSAAVEKNPACEEHASRVCTVIERKSHNSLKQDYLLSQCHGTHQNRNITMLCATRTLRFCSASSLLAWPTSGCHLGVSTTDQLFSSASSYHCNRLLPR